MPRPFSSSSSSSFLLFISTVVFLVIVVGAEKVGANFVVRVFEIEKRIVVCRRGKGVKQGRVIGAAMRVVVEVWSRRKVWGGKVEMRGWGGLWRLVVGRRCGRDGV